jgi:dynein heavy chain 1
MRDEVQSICFKFECHGSCTRELQDIFICRDIVKKKRDEHIKMVWRVSPAHKRLQTRMEHMRSFRRQHEQLRTVIMRVLRPTLLVMSTRQIDQQSQLPGTPDQVEAGDMKSEVLGLEAADASAIEVNCG